MDEKPNNNPTPEQKRNPNPSDNFPGKGFAPDLLQDKVVLVTGGGTGIGRAISEAVVRCGGKLVIYGRRQEVLDEAAAYFRSLGGTVQVVQGDTREPLMAQACMAQIRDQHGRLDVLVNNAGGQFVAAARDISFKGFEAVIRNNLLASWIMTKTAAEHFFFDHGGKVITVTAAVRSGFAGFAHTAAARGGVLTLMKTLATEWAEYGMNINCVAPGTIKTEAMGQYPIEPEKWRRFNRNVLNRLGTPQDVANMILYLASPLGDFITGEEFYVDGGETLHLAHDARDMINSELFASRTRGDTRT